MLCSSASSLEPRASDRKQFGPTCFSLFSFYLSGFTVGTLLSHNNHFPAARIESGSSPSSSQTASASTMVLRPGEYMAKAMLGFSLRKLSLKNNSVEEEDEPRMESNIDTQFSSHSSIQIPFHDDTNWRRQNHQCRAKLGNDKEGGTILSVPKPMNRHQ